MSQGRPRRSLAKIKDEVQFYDHQVEAVNELRKVSSFLLSDVMGLGKTLTALTVAAVDFELAAARRILVVAPASLKENWGDEMDERTHFSYHILTGTPKKRLVQLEAFDRDVLVVNYEQVVAHVDMLSAMDFDIVIYDEAHFIKSYKSKRTKAVFALRAGRHFLLTGSPILNQVNDLWALMHRVSPAEWGSYWSFCNRYAVYGGYMDKQIVGIKNEAELREKLQRVMVRRTKEELGDKLPAKLPVNYIRIEPHPAQAKLIKQAKDELIIEAPDLDDPLDVENAMTAILRIRQICGTTAAIPGHDDHSAKLEVAVRMIEELIGEGESVVVFAQFRKTLHCLTSRLEGLDLPWFQLHGDVLKEHRQGVVRRWSAQHAAGKPSALVCMQQVGGTGFNMVAANTVIFLDRDYAPLLNEQAEDRCHRIGQTTPVTVHVLQIRGTVEQRIDRILKDKTDVFNSAIESDTAWKRKLLRFIMEDDEEETNDG